MHQSTINNKRIKNIFVCEFITAGGLNHAELPAQLAHEGALMRDALLRDLSSLEYNVNTTLDARLPASFHCDYTLIDATSDVWASWQRLMQKADAVWLIAPETDGLLAKLTSMAIHLNKFIFGADLETVRITSSKLSTFQALSQHAIPLVSTYKVSEYRQLHSKTGSWVIKTDDGAGCEHTFLFDEAHELSKYLKQSTGNNVIQPYIAGEPASISCVMHHGRARVLSCNRQLIILKKGMFNYRGSVVNGFSQYLPACEILADKVAQALPGLAGYVGIDIIVVDQSGQPELMPELMPELTLVEINPRLTTSYAGLAAAIGQNPAKLIIEFMTDNDFLWPVLETQQLRINIDQ